MYRLFVILIFCCLSISQVISADKNYVGLIHLYPEKNAYFHNNMGLEYLSNNDYLSAIQEFKIAIGLNNNTQASSIYYGNLGETYLKLKRYADAQDCFENAIRLNPMQFKYYLSLVDTFYFQNNLNAKLDEYNKNKQTPLDNVIIGLIYIRKGSINKGIALLNEFVYNEPKLIITDGVKSYLNTFADLSNTNR